MPLATNVSDGALIQVQSSHEHSNNVGALIGMGEMGHKVNLAFFHHLRIVHA